VIEELQFWHNIIGNKIIIEPKYGNYILVQIYYDRIEGKN